MKSSIPRGRNFNLDVTYEDLDPKNYREAVSNFEKRILEWYIKPGRCLSSEVAFDFATTALSCILLDLLSQFSAGKRKSTPTIFINYLGQSLPQFDVAFPTPLAVVSSTGEQISLHNHASAFYCGFRCGILHSAQIDLFGKIERRGILVEYEPKS